MPLPPSNLHLAAVTLKDRIKGCFGDGVEVVVGTPKKAEETAGQDGHVINLFFYRIAPSGFQPEVHPREPLLVRTWCLFTSFTPSGEEDLRLLGEIMRYVHENPVLAPDADDLAAIAHPFALQAVPAPLEAEEINHVWTTQGDLPYRPSVAYEFAVVPLDPREPRDPVPTVGRGEWTLRPHMRDEETATIEGEVEP